MSGSAHIGNGSSSGNAITFPAGTQYGYKLESGFLIQHFYSVLPSPSVAETTSR